MSAAPDSWPPRITGIVRRADFQHPAIVRAGGTTNRLLIEIEHRMGRGELVIPDYQRPSVWTEAQQAAFVGFLLEGGRPPAIFIRRSDDPSGLAPDELVDGQQRLTAWTRWRRGEIPGVLPWRQRSVWAADLPRKAAMIDIVTATPVVELTCSRADAISLYLLINTGGTPHTEAELDRARRLLAAEQGAPGETP